MMEEWSPIFHKVYDPLKAGSIDATDTEPHDHGIVRALRAKYKPNKLVVGDPKKTIFVARLNPKTDEHTIEKVFTLFGEIKRFRLIRDIVTGFSKCYAFVEYVDREAAKLAYQKTNRFEIDGREILVDFECERELKGWVPRRLGGGLGGKKESGQLRFGGRDRPFRKPIMVNFNRKQDSEVETRYHRDHFGHHERRDSDRLSYCRDRERHDHHARYKESDRKYDRRQSNDKNRDKYRKESHDRDRHDRYKHDREVSHDRDKYREESHDRDKYREESHDRDKYREESHDRERFRGDSRHRGRGDSRDRKSEKKDKRRREKRTRERSQSDDRSESSRSRRKFREREESREKYRDGSQDRERHFTETPRSEDNLPVDVDKYIAMTMKSIWDDNDDK